jgi:hypothetical protein
VIDLYSTKRAEIDPLGKAFTMEIGVTASCSKRRREYGSFLGDARRRSKFRRRDVTPMQVASHRDCDPKPEN